ncbi:hypothetical protein QF032_003771 [Streptomyces achromogenes]|uniref:hypothetical protein n=1 Tax=Streptomyces achromogenes TaxID=67255 RepID=UPI00277DC7C0|nr:hypothetical protein [Streptomyces achromogenes]MDQ0831927.1 hypothetical protein [Streptomyces achromogenes]
MKNDLLKWGALAAALVATASAEYELARAVGFNEWVAAAVPAALDLYTVRALRAHREVLAAVAAMIGVNAASHLVTTGLLPVNVWLVVAVAAIAPLVLWRVHSLGAGHDEPVTPIGVTAVEVAAPVTVERVADDQPRALPAPPKVVIPDTIRLAWKDPDGPTAEPFDLDHKMPRQVTSAVPAETPRQVVTEVVTLTPSELRRRASKLNRELVTSTNRQVTIERLREEFSLTRREAAELRRQVVTQSGGDRS